MKYDVTKAYLGYVGNSENEILVYYNEAVPNRYRVLDKGTTEPVYPVIASSNPNRSAVGFSELVDNKKLINTFTMLEKEMLISEAKFKRIAKNTIRFFQYNKELKNGKR